MWQAPISRHLTVVYLRPLPNGGHATCVSRLGLGLGQASQLSQPAGQGTTRHHLPLQGKGEEVAEQANRSGVGVPGLLGLPASAPGLSRRGVEKGP